MGLFRKKKFIDITKLRGNKFKRIGKMSFLEIKKGKGILKDKKIHF